MIGGPGDGSRRGQGDLSFTDCVSFAVMKFRFTLHAKQKLILLRRYRFNITAKKVKQTVQNPVKIDERNDGTLIATTLFDEKHILRVVYRQEDDIMIVITMYPGRRKAYGF